ncbi:MAG: Holliday junction resolvase RuvX [Clostridia bacterium]|nr:Holliday junction resolvase RuvX [Clostridia bacterium]
MIKKRVIAFDIGDKRIGVAISDPFNEYAMPCETYFRTGKFSFDVEQIAKIAEERGVGVIVCGMPVNFDGSQSVQTEKTEKFINALKKVTAIPVALEDERFTTMQARDTQIAGGVKRGDRKKTVDSIAASYILDGYLARNKAENKKIQEDNKMKQENFNEEYEEENVIELEDDEGNVTPFAHIGTIEYKGAWYCFFQKAEPESEEEEDEVVVFLLQGEGEDQVLLPIEDDQLMDEVFAEFCKEYEAYENSDEAAMLDGAE